MVSRLPPSLPRDAITLLTVLFIVLLVSLPASSSHVAVLIAVGGGVFLLLSPKGSQRRADAGSVASVQSALLAGLSSRSARPEASEPKVQASRLIADGRAVPEKETLPAVLWDEVESAASEKNEPATVPVRLTPQPRPEAAEASLKQPSTSVPGKSAAPSSKAAAAPAADPGAKSAAGAAPALAGGAAVLARLRQQRAVGNKLAAEAAEREAQAKEVVVAYASQTGTAQEIAKGIQAESAGHGIKAKVMSLNELGFEKLVAGKAPLLVVIAASTGDGDSPDNAAVFYATMRRRTQELGILKDVKFTCLGLGDSNYTRFMGVSRSIRTRLQELGAEPFYKMGEADEVDGIESVVDPWIADLWPALKHEVGAQVGSKASVKPSAPSAASEVATQASNGDRSTAPQLTGVPALAACRVALRWVGDAVESAGASASSSGARAVDVAYRDPSGMYSSSQPYLASVASASYLTASTSDRKVLHLELDLGDSGIDYVPGDSLGVTPSNEAALVTGLLDRLGLDGSKRFTAVSAEDPAEALLPHLSCPCSVRDAFGTGTDLTSAPRKSLLRLLAEHCSDDGERRELLHLSSRGGRDAYAALVSPAAPTLLDLLRRFRSCRPPLEALLDALPPLQPRLYSVSSSPLAADGRAHVAFSVVQIGAPPANVAASLDKSARDAKAAGGTLETNRWGVATGWLERKVEPLTSENEAADVQIPIHLRKGGVFGLPADLSAPLIMIGPGTGVTPFRGFLQHRRALLRQHSGPFGPAWLYFGCRSANEDYLYRDDLEGFAADGTLTRLELAFSREGPQKVYVQQRMREQAGELCPLLSAPNAAVFVCGDGAKMAKDVHAALLEVLEQHGGMTADQAAAHLAAMTKNGRYVRDIWS